MMHRAREQGSDETRDMEERKKEVVVMEPSIWGRLPDELLERIVALLPLRTIVALRPTCRRFNSFLSSPTFLSLLQARKLPAFLLLSHPQFSHRCLPLYDHAADGWRSVAVPSPCSSSASAAAASSCFFFLISADAGLLCFTLGRSSLLVANLLTSTSKVVPLPAYSAYSPSAAHLVCLRSPSNTPHGYKIFLPCASSSDVFVYDSAALSWTRFPGFRFGPGRGNPNQNGAFFHGSLYFTTSEPFSVVAFDLQTGAWDIAAAPALPAELAFVRLAGGDGRLFLVGGVGRDGISRSLRLWELVVEKGEGRARKWEELGRLPEMMCRKFVSVCYHNYSHVQCLWHEGLVCICITTWPEVLFYKVSRGTWHWLPRCPMLQDKWCCGFRWFSFAPDLFALV